MEARRLKGQVGTYSCLDLCGKICQGDSFKVQDPATEVVEGTQIQGIESPSKFAVACAKDFVKEDKFGIKESKILPPKVEVNLPRKERSETARRSKKQRRAEDNEKEFIVKVRTSKFEVSNRKLEDEEEVFKGQKSCHGGEGETKKNSRSKVQHQQQEA